MKCVMYHLLTIAVLSTTCFIAHGGQQPTMSSKIMEDIEDSKTAPETGATKPRTAPSAAAVQEANIQQTTSSSERPTAKEVDQARTGATS